LEQLFPTATVQDLFVLVGQPSHFLLQGERLGVASSVMKPAKNVVNVLG
jgi:hypothetical protein